MRPVLSLRTWAAIRSSARQPLQIWRVTSSRSRPSLPVHLVRGDAGGVVAVEERGEALAEDLDAGHRDEPLLDDEEAVAPEALDLLVGDVIKALRYLRVAGARAKQPLEAFLAERCGWDAGARRGQLGGASRRAWRRRSWRWRRDWRCLGPGGRAGGRASRAGTEAGRGGADLLRAGAGGPRRPRSASSRWPPRASLRRTSPSWRPRWPSWARRWPASSSPAVRGDALTGVLLAEAAAVGGGAAGGDQRGRGPGARARPSGRTTSSEGPSFGTGRPPPPPHAPIPR